MESNDQQRVEQFVSRTITLCHDKDKQDKGLRARLRRADNPVLQSQSWDYLARYNVDLENPAKYLPYSIVASAIAKTKRFHDCQNGHLDLGTAIAECYRDEKQSTLPQDNEQALAKLRRVLACQDIHELFQVLRPLLALIESRVTKPLDYIHLLQQLCLFDNAPDRTKAQWAMKFYRKQDNASDQESA